MRKNDPVKHVWKIGNHPSFTAGINTLLTPQLQRHTYVVNDGDRCHAFLRLGRSNLAVRRFVAPDVYPIVIDITPLQTPFAP